MKINKTFLSVLLIFSTLLFLLIINSTYASNLDSSIINFDYTLGVDKENKTVKYLSDNTTVIELLNKISIIDDNQLIVYDLDNKKNSTDVLATGDKLSLVADSGEVIDEYIISILGDVNSDSVVNKDDVEKLFQFYRSDLTLDTQNIIAGDVKFNDGVVISTDDNIDLTVGENTLIDYVVFPNDEVVITLADVAKLYQHILGNVDLDYNQLEDAYDIELISNDTDIVSVSNMNITGMKNGETSVEIFDKLTGVKKEISVNVSEKLASTIMLEDFEDVNDVEDVFSKTDLSQNGVIYPKEYFVNNEVEDSLGLYLDFNDSKDSAWAQIYNFSNNIATNFSKITDDYYLRFWFSNGDNDDVYISLLLNNGNSFNYIDANSVKLIKYNSDSVEVSVDNKAGYGTSSSVKIPKGFKGWISFPLDSLVGDENNLINLSDVRYISIDIRPDTPKANTYYVMDNLCLSTEVQGNSYDIKNEIQYKTDLVGIFYSVWFDFWEVVNNNNSQYVDDGYVDSHKIFVAEEENGNLNDFHYWGTPYLGYYTSSNSDVIKQHMRWLSNAGVDFIFVDFTNLMHSTDSGTWYYQVTKPFKVLLDTMNEMIENGERVPKVVPWLGNWQEFNNFNESNTTVLDKFYDTYYVDNTYDNLWLYYNGKPFVMTVVEYSDERFTYRNTWALYSDQNSINNGEWTWRQPLVGNSSYGSNILYGKDNFGNLEEMSVNTAISTYYMSYTTDSTVTNSRNNGITFYEQWKNVFSKHPKITLVGTWNEWGAQKLACVYDTNEYCFTDQYNQEYSNDIEPLLGGHGDKYYRMLIKYIEDYRNYNEIIGYYEYNIDDYISTILK